MPFRVGGKGGSGGGAVAVPTDLRFAGANLAACQTARDTFFTNNPSRKVKDVRILLEPSGDDIVLQEWDGASTWKDMTSIVRGPQGDIASNLVQSVNGQTGVVNITKTTLNLGNVDNTSDLDKPVSNATQSILNNKAPLVHTHNIADINNLATSLSSLSTSIDNKQDKLVSGTNIKTVNGNSLLGTGNIVIDAVQDATSAVTGGVRLTGDLGGSATAPKVEKINGIAVSNSGVLTGKVLRATSATTSAFETITAADVGAIPTSAKGANDGVAELDANGKLPSARLPSGIVQSVNGLTGVVTINKNTISLGNVDNTADADKPLSNDAKTELNKKVNSSLLGAPSGVATLDNNGKIPSSQLGSINMGETYVVANSAARLALNTATKGDIAVQVDTNESYVLQATPAATAGNWVKLLFPASVTSVNTKTGAVTLTKADLNLGNVDNTTDLGKPISTATQAALNTKANNLDHEVSSQGVRIKLYNDSTELIGSTIFNATPTTGGIMSSDDKAKLDGLHNTVVENSLTSTSTTDALAANQGKELKTLIDTKISNSLISEKGQVVVGTAANTPSALAKGTNGQVLTADSTAAAGVKWADVPSAPSIIDALDSTSSTNPLSAKQGKTLNENSIKPYYNRTFKAGDKIFFHGAVLKANADIPLHQGTPFGTSGQTYSLDPDAYWITPDRWRADFAGGISYLAGDIVVYNRKTWRVVEDFASSNTSFDTWLSQGKLVAFSIMPHDIPSVNDTLTSTSTIQALSANQGKVLKTLVDAKANLASPTFTGTPLSTTAAADTNTTQIATTAFVIGQAASATPSALGTAAVGTSTRYARADHVHALPSGLIPEWALANTYSAGAVVMKGTEGIFKASGAVAANTAWALGTGANQWSPLTRVVYNDELKTIVQGLSYETAVSAADPTLGRWAIGKNYCDLMWGTGNTGKPAKLAYRFTCSDDATSIEHNTDVTNALWRDQIFSRFILKKQAVYLDKDNQQMYWNDTWSTGLRCHVPYTTTETISSLNLVKDQTDITVGTGKDINVGDLVTGTNIPDNTFVTSYSGSVMKIGQKVSNPTTNSSITVQRRLEGRLHIDRDAWYLISKNKTRIGIDGTNTYLHSPDQKWRFWFGNGGITVNKDGVGNMMEVFDGTYNIRGTWGNISSDRRMKTDITEFPEALLDAWGKYVKWLSYNWIEKIPNSATEKTHAGLIAQDVVTAFEEAGIDWKKWRVVEYNESEDRFGVCYDHCNAIENAYQRRRLDRIEKALGLV